MRKIYTTLLGFLSIASVSYSQVSGYTYTQSTATFTPLTLGQNCTPSGATFDDEVYYTPGTGTPNLSGTSGPGLTLPFTFTYNGVPCNAIGVNANGWVALKPTANATVTVGSSSYRPLSASNAGTTYAIAAMAQDNEGSSTASLKYQVVGTAPNRSFVVEWLGFQRYQVTTDVINFQIRINENNTITFHYGNCTSTNTGTAAGDGMQVGLKGTTNADFKNLVSTTTWNNPPYGTTNTDNDELTYEAGIFPATNVRYTWTAPSCTAPTNINITSTSATALSASWTASPSASGGYQYAFSTSATPPASGTTTTLTTVNATGQPTNTVIYLHVRSNCGGTFSGWATKAFVPCVTGNVSPANGATNIIPPPQLVWNTVAGANGYTIMWSSNGGSTYANIGTLTANVPQYVTDTAFINNTAPSTQYFWYVRPNVPGDTASTTCVSGAWSLTTQASPTNDSCGSPTTLTNGVGVAGSTISATQSIAPVSCAGFTAAAPINDVWFSVTALSNGALSISSTTTDATFDCVLFLYSGLPGVGCAGVTQLACADATGSGGNETINYATAVAGTTYYIRAYDYFGQGTFTITASGPALPISLLSFTGIKQDKTNILNWSTASETNNKGFELQRSANGNDFTSITFVNSKAVGGNSSAQLNYSFSDITPLGGINYYRLKQMDKDGRFAMSNVVAIKGPKPTSLQLVGVYPNPAVNKLNVNIESPVVDYVTLLVTDMTGKVLMNKMKTMAVGDNNVELNVSTLPAGSYFIKAVCANGCETSTAKFVKQ